MVFWQQDGTSTSPPSFETTAEADELVAFDTTALLVDGNPPTSPEATLFRIVDNGADVAVALADAPTVASGNTITQRFRNLDAGTVYRYRLTFATGGNRRPLTLFVLCDE